MTSAQNWPKTSISSWHNPRFKNLHKPEQRKHITTCKRSLPGAVSFGTTTAIDTAPPVGR